MKEKQKAEEKKQPRAQATMIPGAHTPSHGVTDTPGCTVAQLHKNGGGGEEGRERHLLAPHRTSCLDTSHKLQELQV